jgi:hypothetical protein
VQRTLAGATADFRPAAGSIEDGPSGRGRPRSASGHGLGRRSVSGTSGARGRGRATGPRDGRRVGQPSTGGASPLQAPNCASLRGSGCRSDGRPASRVSRRRSARPGWNSFVSCPGGQSDGDGLSFPIRSRSGRRVRPRVRLRVRWPPLPTHPRPRPTPPRGSPRPVRRGGRGGRGPDRLLASAASAGRGRPDVELAGPSRPDPAGPAGPVAAPGGARRSPRVGLPAAALMICCARPHFSGRSHIWVVRLCGRRRSLGQPRGRRRRPTETGRRCPPADPLCGASPAW